VPGNNIRTAMFNQWYSFYPNSALVDMWAPEIDAGIHYNYDGVKKEQWVVPNVYAQLKGQININAVYFLVNGRTVQGVQFRNINRVSFNLNSRPLGVLSLYSNFAFGRFINRSDAPALGTGHTINLTAMIKPTSQFQVELDFSRARLKSVGTGELFSTGISRVQWGSTSSRRNSCCA